MILLPSKGTNDGLRCKEPFLHLPNGKNDPLLNSLNKCTLRYIKKIMIKTKYSMITLKKGLIPFTPES